MTTLKDIIDPSTFTVRVRELMEEKNKFIQIGALQRSSVLDDFCNYVDNTSFQDVAVRLIRYQTWNVEKFAQLDSEAIAQRIADYENRRLQQALLSILIGVSRVDVTFDASGTEFVPGVTQFTESNLSQAKQRLANPDALVLHSAVYSRLKKNGLITTSDDSPFPMLDEMLVTWDNGMPKNGNVYDSYLLSTGALVLGWGDTNSGTEIETVVEEASSTEVLTRTWNYSIHPTGHAYQGPRTKAGPTNLILADEAAWGHQGFGDGVRIIKFRTREA